jgi:PAS domain S-box-containing protein
MGTHDIIMPWSEIRHCQVAVVKASENNRGTAKIEDASLDNVSFQTLIDVIPHPFFALDRQGRFAVTNRSFRECLTEQSIELIREFISGLAEQAGHDTVPAYRKHDGTACGGNRVEELRLEFSDGTVRDALLSVSAPGEGKGGPFVAAGVVLDITERKRVEAEISRESEINTTIAELSKMLLSEYSLEEFSNMVLSCAKKLTGSRFGFAGYIDPHTGYMFSVTMTRDVFDECAVPDKSVVFKKFTGLWGWVLENRTALMTNSPSEDSRSSGTPEGHIPINNFIAAPAMTGDTLLGMVALANSEQGYSDIDLALVKKLADQYALAIRRMQAEDELRSSKDFAEKITETADAMVVLRDLEGKVLMFNQAAEDITGYLKDEIIGSNWFETVSPRDRYPDNWSRFEKFVSTLSFPKEPFDYPILTRSGEERYISMRSSELRDEDKIIGVLSVGIDITERRQALEQLRESEDRYRTLFEAAADGIFVSSKDGTILDCNPAALEISGFLREDVLGHNITEFVSGEILRKMPDLLVRIASSAGAPLETVMLGKGGRKVDVEISAQTITLQGEEHIIGYVRDITERKRRERELGELTRELKAFASTLSHDLRSPLGVALGYATTLRRLYGDRLDEIGREGLEAMVVSLEKINLIIEGMLEYVRVGSHEERCEDVVLGLIAEGIAHELRENGRLNGIDLEIAGDLPVVQGNPVRFYQVLNNLISNAVKFSTGHPGARVEVGWLSRDGFGVIFVKDNGPGIPPDQLDRVFEPLFRTEEARNTPGHGLGLAIVRRAVESWGGRVWTESEPGLGTTFFFTLPPGVSPSHFTK